MKYERITKTMETINLCFGCENDCDTCPINDSVWERLAELEDKIENGTLIELPCKVGDTVYMVYSVCVEEWEVTSIIISYANIILRLGHIGTDDFNSAWLKEAGDRLFFTREEAEKRLKEIQE